MVLKKDFLKKTVTFGKRLSSILNKKSKLKNFKNIISSQLSLFLLAIVVMIFGFLYLYSNVYAQDGDAAKRADIELKIQVLETQSQDLDNQLQGIQTQNRSLENEKRSIDTEVKKRELEIKRLSLLIDQSNMQIEQKNIDVTTLTKNIADGQKALSASLFLLYVYDQDNTLVNLLKNKSLSDYFSNVSNVEKTQSTVGDKLQQFRDDRQQLEQQKTDLLSFKSEQQDLEALQEVERRALAQKKKEKEDLIQLTKGKESVFQQLLKSKKQDIASLRTQLFYLEKTGVTAENAVGAADFAAKKAGIRTAFLLALLEVETGKNFEDGVISAGTRVGTGSWKKDLYDCYVNIGKTSTAESEKNAFLDITSRLNLNPDTMPVSKKPSYGCGGAMGPAQFLPSTWKRYESKVTELTGHANPNPWDVEDSFTAAAVLLADAGADSKTPTGEVSAAKVYISGHPDCGRSVCNWYANQILALAKDIDRIL